MCWLLAVHGSVLCSSSCSLGPYRRLGDQLMSSCPYTHPLSCLPLSRAALVLIFFGENDIYDQVENSPESWWLQDQLHRAVEALFCSSMAVESSSTALVLCPTTDLSPLWLSLDPGREVEELQGKGPGLLL